MEGIDNSIMALQRVKESLRLFLNVSPNRINLDEVIDAFNVSANNMVDNYEKSTSHLRKLENSIFHDAKNATLKTNSYLYYIHNEYQKEKKLPKDFYERVQKFINTFSELQELLRDVRISKIKDYL